MGRTARLNIYKWRQGENSAIFLDGKYKAGFFQEDLLAVDIPRYVSEDKPIILKVFWLNEDEDKEIYFEDEYSEDEQVFIKWMETH